MHDCVRPWTVYTVEEILQQLYFFVFYDLNKDKGKQFTSIAQMLPYLVDEGSITESLARLCYHPKLKAI